MVLDESALEAMLARQRAAERDHEETPSVRTVKTDEFEVYERQVPDAPATARPPAASSHRPGPSAQDFEELPGRQGHPGSDPGGAVPAADPRWPGGTEPPAPTAQTPSAAPTAQTPSAAAPAAQAHPPAQPSPQAHPVAQPSAQAPQHEPTAVRRPQVWPPIGKPAAPDARQPAAPSGPEAPAPSLAAPRPAPQPDVARPADGPARPRAPSRSHAPTPAAPSGVGDASGCRIAIVQAMFNHEITDEMAAQAIRRAQDAGAQTSHHQVPGVYDLPLTVQHLARRKDVDAVVVIGCVIRGETKHDELITFTAAKTLQEISLATDTPVALGITGPGMTWQQAQARIGNGAHAVDAAVAMWRAMQTA